MEFVIITGMSGAGKSQAMKAMEDLKYYCIDNLPPALLWDFVELCLESKKNIDRLAVVVDIRAGEFFEDLFASLNDLREKGVSYKILYLDATDDTLVRRYKELRRPHPLNPDGSILEGIEEERELLYNVKRKSDYIIDTTKLNNAALKEKIYDIFLRGDKTDDISILVTSFGFKHGAFLEGDMVFDVRFVPNPYYIPELKDFTGENPLVRDYVFSWEQTEVFVEKTIDMIEYLLPYYLKEGKRQLIVGIGCTGGMHRSVAISEEIYKILSNKGHRIHLHHRDSGLR